MDVIRVNDYKLIKLIGKGTFGEVYLTSNINNSEIYATKRIEINKDQNKTTSKYLLNEIKIMQALNHPNLIKLHNLYRTNNHFYFIMDYCNGGSLSSILDAYKLRFGKPFSQEIIQHFMIQIVDGLKYIHSKNIIHRDIKLDNILLNFDNIEDKNNLNLLSAKIKIIDFGLATILSKNGMAKTYAGTPLNMDPNILKKYDKAGGYEKLQGYNQKADIWSLGTICFEMLTGEVLFKGENIKDLVEQEDQGDYSIPINFEISKEIISFLKSMLQYNGENRLSAEELSKHEFLVKDVKNFAKINFQLMSNKIENGMLNFNIKHNSTLIQYIKNEEKCLPKIGNSRLKKINKNEEEKNNLIYLDKKVNNQFISIKNPISNNYFSPTSPKKISFISANLKNQNRIIDALKSPSRFRIRGNSQDVITPTLGLEDVNNNITQLDRKQKGLIPKPIRFSNPNNKVDVGKYINNLLNEYKNAEDYFKKNNLTEQEKEAFNKCAEIKDIKDKIELNSSYDLNNLPKPISPEFIYGCSKEERNRKFKNVLNKYLNDKRILEQKLKYYSKYAITKNIIEECNKDKTNLKKLNSDIKILENNFKNEWVPSPKYSLKTKLCQVERISYENCYFQIKFKFKKEDYIQENINLKISFLINAKKTLYKEVRLAMDNNFSEEWTCLLNYNEWKNIDNNSESFILIMETDHIFENNSKSSIKIDIRKIKAGKKICLKLSLLTMNNNKSVINFIAIPVIPEGIRYIAQVKNKVLMVEEFYSAFEGKILAYYS